MAENTATTRGRRGFWRIAPWAVATLLLLTPLVAMQFTDEVDWDETDFIVMGAMLAAACGLVELGARASGSLGYRLGVAVAVLTGFLTVWANLAIGMIGSEDNPHNLVFAGVLGIALVGAIAARSRGDLMARVMAAAALAQFLAAAVGLLSDMRGGIFSMLFTLPWLLSMALFRHAARR